MSKEVSIKVNIDNYDVCKETQVLERLCVIEKLMEIYLPYLSIRSEQIMANINDVRVALEAVSAELSADIDRLIVAVDNTVVHDHEAEADVLMADIVAVKDMNQTRFLAAIEKLEQAFPAPAA